MTSKFGALRLRLESEHKRLVEELEQLRATASSTEDRREGSPFGKREEEATETLELERRLALEKQVREQLSDVETALGKFDKDAYGKCERCGQPIDPARMEALPQAKLCVDCKTHQGRNAKGRAPSG